MHFIEIEVIKRMDLEKNRFANAINQISKQCSDENSQVKEVLRIEWYLDEWICLKFTLGIRSISKENRDIGNLKKLF